MGKKTFDDKCKFRYSEFRKGDTKKGNGEHTLYERCVLRDHGNQKCPFPDKTNKDCPISITKKRKVEQGFVRFKGKWKKKSGGL